MSVNNTTSQTKNDQITLNIIEMIENMTSSRPSGPYTSFMRCNGKILKILGHGPRSEPRSKNSHGVNCQQRLKKTINLLQVLVVELLRVESALN